MFAGAVLDDRVDDCGEEGLRPAGGRVDFVCPLGGATDRRRAPIEDFSCTASDAGLSKGEVPSVPGLNACPIASELSMFLLASLVGLDCGGGPRPGANDGRPVGSLSCEPAGVLPVRLREGAAPPTDGLAARLGAVAADGPVEVRLAVGGAMLGRDLVVAVAEGRPLPVTGGVPLRIAGPLGGAAAVDFVGDFVGDWSLSNRQYTKVIIRNSPSIRLVWLFL